MPGVEHPRCRRGDGKLPPSMACICFYAQPTLDSGHEQGPAHRTGDMPKTARAVRRSGLRHVFHGFMQSDARASPHHLPYASTYRVLALPVPRPLSVLRLNPNRHVTQGVCHACCRRRLVDTHPSVGVRENLDEHRAVADKLVRNTSDKHRFMGKQDAARGLGAVSDDS